MAQNSIEYVVAILGAHAIGVSVVPLNIRLIPRDWQRNIDRARLKLLLLDADFREKLTGTPTFLISEPFNSRGSLSNPPTLSFEREAFVVFTSGSSAEPKGVSLSLRSVLASAAASNLNSGFGATDSWLLSVPLFHVAGIGIIFRALAANARVVIPKNLSAVELLSSLERHAPTFASLVPTQLIDLYKLLGEEPLSAKLRVLMLGGGFIPESLLCRTAKTHKVITTYGMTECNSHICATPPTDDTDLLSTSGRPLAGSTVRIVDSAGGECAPMQEGEITISGDCLFSRYLGDGGKILPTDASAFRTGDRGYLRKDGSLVVCGRSERLIKSGGEKIQLEEIERLAALVPGVAECAAIARADARWGERPVLFVVPKQDQELSVELLRAELLKSLPKFKIPDEVFFLHSLPRTGSGKVDALSLSRVSGLSQAAP